MKSQIVASECNAAHFPQNSLSGFHNCLDQNIDGIEFDVHLSRDGAVVIQHDTQLNKQITRDKNGDWLQSTGPALGDLTLDELRQYDIGRYLADSAEAEAYPNYQPIDGEKIPTLDQFLAAHDQHVNKPTLWIELKSSPFERTIGADPEQLLDKVMAVVLQYDLVAHCILIAFEWDVLVTAKEKYPDIQTDFLTINSNYIRSTLKNQPDADPYLLYGEFEPRKHDKDFAKAIAAAGGDWWGPLITDVTPADVEYAQSLGIKVNLWNVESTQQGIEHAISFNADALTISDATMLQRQMRLSK
ncbi:MAG: glycerophosphodiester phosphodiesterase family protein [Pseudomonadales bacterium]|jgi:glycerophosphoryl diester phosphodiesterase